MKNQYLLTTVDGDCGVNQIPFLNMAFLDRFKGKKEKRSDEGQKGRGRSVKVAKRLQRKKPLRPVAKAAPPKDSTAYRVLGSSDRFRKDFAFGKEAASTLSPSLRHANKVEIKKAVEKHYRVHVTSVNVVNVGGKIVRSGRVERQAARIGARLT